MSSKNAPFRIPIRNQESIDWEQPHTPRNSCSHRLANAFLVNYWCSDMAFYVPVDDSTIPAHSVIVAAASPVLQRCCLGAGGTKGGRIVAVPDGCSTEVLLIVLDYIYSGGIADGVDESNAGQILKMAVFYELGGLQKQYETKIESILTAGNVCGIFNRIHNSSSECAASCLRFMETHFDAILSNGSAMEMEDAALSKQLGTTQSRVCKMKLMKPMRVWVDAQCLQRSMENSPANRRHILGERLNMIHFDSMSMSDYMECVNLFGCFNDNEISLTTQRIHRQTPSTNGLKYATATESQSSCGALVETCCDVKLSHHSAGVYDQYFVLYVGHLKTPFTLTGLKIYNHCFWQSFQIQDLSTGAVLPIYYHNEFAKMSVMPDANGYVSLIIHSHHLQYLYAVAQFDTANNGPRIMSTDTCVTAFTYTHPK